MSRSQWAWEQIRASRDAARGGREGPESEDRAHLGRGPLPSAVASTSFLGGLLAASILLLSLAPASALAGSARGGSSASPTRITHVDVVALALGSGYASSRDAARVRTLQRRLARDGYGPGPIDGHYGPRTEQAVIRFQAARGLRVDGIAGPFTLAALRKPSVILYPGLGYAGRGSRRVGKLQRDLAAAGYAPGPIDGRYGPRTKQAVIRFQAARGLRVDGIAGPQTLTHLGIQRVTTNHRAGRGSRPAGSHRVGSRTTAKHGRHQAGQRRHTAHRRPVRAPAPGGVVPAGRTTGSASIGLLVLLIALAVVLGVSAIWFARRHRVRAVSGAAVMNGASDRDRPDAIAADTRPTTTAEPEPTTEPEPEPAPEPEPEPIAALELRAPDIADQVFRQAVVLEEQGDYSAAIAAYGQADELGHAGAACNLGVLFEQLGDPASAEAAYGRADHRGSPDGAFNLAVLLEEQGQLVRAALAYRRADRRGHATAATNLGLLLEQDGDLTSAMVAFRRASQRGDAAGAFNLGVLLHEQGDRIAALQAYERAAQLGDARISERARAAALELRSEVESPTLTGEGGGLSGR